MRIVVKKYKYVIFAMAIVLGLIFASFYQYYKDYYSYYPEYYRIKNHCTFDKEERPSYCNRFSSKENLDFYLENSDPVKRYQRLDAITLTSEIVENNIFSSLQIFSPLLIMIAVIGTIHSAFQSGMFKNYLLRMSYKKYLQQIQKTIFAVAFMMPLALIIVFFLSCCITKFNFNIDAETMGFAVYDAWKYHHFLLYGSIICIIQYLMGIMYGELAVLCCRKNKSMLVSIILGYLLFLCLNIFIYVGVYSILLNKLLGFKNLSEYFNIAGYWFFNQPMNYGLLILIVLIMSSMSYLITSFIYRSKEKRILEYEKQNT